MSEQNGMDRGLCWKHVHPSELVVLCRAERSVARLASNIYIYIYGGGFSPMGHLDSGRCKVSGLPQCGSAGCLRLLLLLLLLSLSLSSSLWLSLSLSLSLSLEKAPPAFPQRELNYICFASGCSTSGGPQKPQVGINNK